MSVERICVLRCNHKGDNGARCLETFLGKATAPASRRAAAAAGWTYVYQPAVTFVGAGEHSRVDYCPMHWQFAQDKLARIAGKKRAA